MRKGAARQAERPGLSAIYCRISDDATGERAGVERQLKDCRALARSKGWETIVYRDDDISASKYTRKRRPAYRDMLAKVRTGEVNRIICWHIDRLYRQPKELEELIDLADEGSVEIVSVTSGPVDLSTSDGIAMARVQVAFAAKASDDMSRRILRQKAEAREQGLPMGHRTAFGWVDYMVPNPDEAALLTEAMKAVLDGASLNTIARSWNKRGVASKGGAKAWNGTRVRDTLSNPRHAGLMTFQGEVIGEATWPAIVDRELSERVRAILDVRGGPFKGNHRGPRGGTLLGGLMRCGRCGGRMWRANTNGNSAWRCPMKAGFAGCGLSIKAEPLENKVTQAVFQVVDELELARLVTDHDHEDDHQATVIALGAVERRTEELGELYAAGEIDARAFTAASRTLRAESEALHSRLARTARTTALVPYVARKGALKAAWDDLDPELRRACVGEVVDTIIIVPGRAGPRFDPARVTINWRF
jgi:DNA invertase Pin-like site-specific DNA recombinase